jgi:FKBP-type peptidyl-prolyl cis-trans isomerase SlyD
MQIAKNTVVMLTFELMDADGNVIEKTDDPIAYLHGGYHGIFPLVEQALDGKAAGQGSPGAGRRLRRIRRRAGACRDA